MLALSLLASADFNASSYFVAEQNEDCLHRCQRKGLPCNPTIETANTPAIFAALGGEYMSTIPSAVVRNILPNVQSHAARRRATCAHLNVIAAYGIPQTIPRSWSARVPTGRCSLLYMGIALAGSVFPLLCLVTPKIHLLGGFVGAETQPRRSPLAFHHFKYPLHRPPPLDPTFLLVLS
jgi:hypothetical protein